MVWLIPLDVKPVASARLYKAESLETECSPTTTEVIVAPLVKAQYFDCRSSISRVSICANHGFDITKLAGWQALSVEEASPELCARYDLSRGVTAATNCYSFIDNYVKRYLGNGTGRRKCDTETTPTRTIIISGG